MKVLLSLILSGLLPPLAFAAGPSTGGGGSDEAKIFTLAARNKIEELLQNKMAAKYAEQFSETLSSALEINLVDSLDDTCDRNSVGKSVYAYSCRGQINLLKSKWGNPPTGEGRLQNENIAKSYIVDIIHEIARAGDERAPTFITNDPGYSVTLGELSAYLEAGSYYIPNETQLAQSERDKISDEFIVGDWVIVDTSTRIQRNTVGVSFYWSKIISIESDNTAMVQEYRKRISYGAPRKVPLKNLATRRSGKCNKIQICVGDTYVLSPLVGKKEYGTVVGIFTEESHVIVNRNSKLERAAANSFEKFYKPNN